MRMLRPSPGEVADRQTILNLKAQYGEQKKVRVDKFVEENELLQQHLEMNWFPELPSSKGIEYDEYFDQLAEVNLQLWKLEDEARDLRATHEKGYDNFGQLDKRAREVLFEITVQNDKRAEVVRKINLLFGQEQVEKIYA